MAKYITVLNSDVNKAYWKAVQMADSLDAIRANRFYTAGVSSSIPKKNGDTFIESKTITEVSLQVSAGAQVYKLAAETTMSMLHMTSRASKAMTKKIESSLKKNS